MKYIYDLNMIFKSNNIDDKNFGWELIPVDFEYNADKKLYTFSKKFYEFNDIKEWIDKFIPPLISNLKCEDDNVSNEIKKSLLDLKSCIYSNVDYENFITGKYMMDIRFNCNAYITNFPFDAHLIYTLYENDITMIDVEKYLWKLIDKNIINKVILKENKNE